MLNGERTGDNMYYAGIDLGGTNIAAGIINEKYEIISYYTTPTLPMRGQDAVTADMAFAVNKALEKAGLMPSDIVQVGIGAPGTCDVKRGIVFRSYSLDWTDVPVCDLLRRYFSVPVKVDNDANCAALGEARAGAGKGCENVVLITIGTGIGTGIIINGKIYSGLMGAGAEMGHMTLKMDGVQCVCGRRGCFDAYAATTALIRQAKDAASRHPESILNKYTGIDGKAVFDAADAGDRTAAEVLEIYYGYLAQGVCDVVNALAPEIVLIGGGVSRQGEKLLKPIREYVAAHAFDRRPEAISRIACASLGNEAGIVGAALL